jgi:hypothetical protein
MGIKTTKSIKVFHYVVDLIGGGRYAMIEDSLPVSTPFTTTIDTTDIFLVSGQVNPIFDNYKIISVNRQIISPS